MLSVDDCCACSLYLTRIHLVAGEGNCSNGVMFVGEAPGEEEDKEGRPFVGSAGKTLRRLIIEASLDPYECRITNIVKCRPPDNRKPKRAEIISCSGHLSMEIAVFQPKVIVSVGLTSSQLLTGTKKPLRDLIHEQTKYLFEGVRVLPVYHTSALCINRNKGAVDQILKGIRLGAQIAGIGAPDQKTDCQTEENVIS